MVLYNDMFPSRHHHHHQHRNSSYAPYNVTSATTSSAPVTDTSEIPSGYNYSYAGMQAYWNECVMPDPAAAASSAGGAPMQYFAGRGAVACGSGTLPNYEYNVDDDDDDCMDSDNGDEDDETTIDDSHNRAANQVSRNVTSASCAGQFCNNNNNNESRENDGNNGRAIATGAYGWMRKAEEPQQLNNSASGRIYNF